MNRIIKSDKSIIPACDFNELETLKQLVKETCDVEGVGGYKIGFQLVIPHGIKKIIEIIKKHTNLPIIYDHQKAGTDIPDTADGFMKAVKGVNGVILFPQSGPETEKAWINAALKEKIDVIVGGEMTHKGYFEFIKEDAPKKIYEIASKLGINDFVVPGNKPERIRFYRKLLGEKAVFYSPGLIAQGGKLTDSAKAAGSYWHAIIGRGIYQQKDMHKAAKELVKKII